MGILVGVIWAGISGRPPPAADMAVASLPLLTAVPAPLGSPPPSPTLPAVPAPTPTPARTPAATTPRAESPSPTHAPTEAFEIVGTVGVTPFRATLVDLLPGHFAAQHWLSDRPSGDELSFEIRSLPTTRSARRGVSLGSWRLSLAELAGNHRAGIAPVTAEVRARPRRLRAPRPIRLGYDLTVSVRLAYSDVVVIHFAMRMPGA